MRSLLRSGLVLVSACVILYYYYAPYPPLIPGKGAFCLLLMTVSVDVNVLDLFMYVLLAPDTKRLPWVATMNLPNHESLFQVSDTGNAG